VVNAAGVDAPEIGRMVGLEIPVGPNRGQQLILEPGPHAIRGAVYGHIPVRQTRAGTCILGGVRETAGFDKRVTSEGVHFIAREAAQMMPSLGQRAVIRAFSGLRPVPADGLPILGPAPGVAGFFLAALHFGLTLAPLVGDLLAQCVLGKPTSVDVGPYSLARFAPAGKIPAPTV
jgi:sarcosine oxidase subunit beta